MNRAVLILNCIFFSWQQCMFKTQALDLPCPKKIVPAKLKDLSVEQLLSLSEKEQRLWQKSLVDMHFRGSIGKPLFWDKTTLDHGNVQMHVCNKIIGTDGKHVFVVDSEQAKLRRIDFSVGFLTNKKIVGITSSKDKILILGVDGDLSLFIKMFGGWIKREVAKDVCGAAISDDGLWMAYYCSPPKARLESYLCIMRFNESTNKWENHEIENILSFTVNPEIFISNGTVVLRSGGVIDIRRYAGATLTKSDYRFVGLPAVSDDGTMVAFCHSNGFKSWVDILKLNEGEWECKSIEGRADTIAISRDNNVIVGLSNPDVNIWTLEDDKWSMQKFCTIKGCEREIIYPTISDDCKTLTFTTTAFSAASGKSFVYQLASPSIDLAVVYALAKDYLSEEERQQLSGAIKWDELDDRVKLFLNTKGLGVAPKRKRRK